ncbi:hypothetical protein GCM10027516_11730 [Niabella aquatica]
MTTGKAEVNGVGAATYTIPIDLPADVRGYKPDVNLIYNSQGGGNDFSGYGWSLSSISTISRCGQNIFHDGVNMPVTYDQGNDKFILDGQRMMLVSGSYGVSGSTYGMEQENFSLITANGGSLSSPDSFMVKMKDGSLLTYGGNNTHMRTGTSGSDIMFWPLTSVEDTYGNARARYYYSIDEADHTYYLSSITYSMYTVNFSYDTRSDWSNATMYVPGTGLNSRYILNRITVRMNLGPQIKSYSFAYQYRHKKYFLTSITEAGADGTELNPVTFSYGESPAEPDVSISGIEYAGFSQDNYAADFTGDGKDDIQTCQYATDNDGMIHHTGYKIVNDYSSYGGLPAINWVYDCTLPVYPTNGRTRLAGSATAQYSFERTDYDGDGKHDVLYFKFEKINSSTLKIQGLEINYSRKYYGVGGGYDTYENKAYYPYPSDGSTTFYFIKKDGSFFVPGDFDGDGHLDYIFISSNNTTANNYKAFFSSPSKGVINREITRFGVGVNGASGAYASYKVAEAKAIIPINFDGDGKTELLVVRNEGSYVLDVTGNSTVGYRSDVLYSTTSIKAGYKIYPGDFNGDGNTDLLVRSSANDPNAAWNIFYSTGLVFNSVPFTAARKIYLQGDGYSLFHNLVVADYDGDGKTDIWHSIDETSNTSTQYVYYSNGLSFTTESYAVNEGVNTFLSTVSGDINGDGKADLLSIRQYSSGSGYQYKGRFIFPKLFKEQNLLKEVSNLGYLTRFNYQLLNNTYGYGDVYSRSYNEEFDVVNQPLRSYMVPKYRGYVVSSIERPNGVGGYFKDQYRYEDLVVHRQGRGLLGFKKITVINDLGIHNISTSDINLTYSILYPVQQVSGRYGISDLITKSDISSSFQLLSARRFFVKTDRIHSKNYKTNAASNVIHTYDSYGNITQSVAQTGVSDGTNLTSVLESTNTTTSYGAYGGAAYPGFPLSVSVSKTRTGQPAVSKTISYTYTSEGLPATVTDYAGTPIAQTVTNTYNWLGLLVQQSISAPGVTTPVTEYVYNRLGNYLLEKKVIGDGITKKTSYTYDTRWCVPLTETSTDGLVTSYIYNTFGELIQTIYPDMNSTVITRAWDVVNGSVYHIRTAAGDGKLDNYSFIDILGREVHRQERWGVNGGFLYSYKNYNILGQLSQETLPYDYFGSEPANIATYTYDNYGRLQTTSNTTGILTTSYSNAGGSTFTVTTTNSASQSSSKTSDASGKMISSTENGNTMSFTYDSWGNQLTASSGAQTFVTHVYDSYGRKTFTTDVNAGTFGYQYNAIGQVIQQTDAGSNVQNMTYDVFGRAATTTGPQGTTTYTYYYDAVSGNSNNNLARVTGFSGDVTTYNYDALQRLSSETIAASGSSLTKTYTYDSRGSLATTTYPAGFTIRNEYDIHSNALKVVKYENGATTKTLFTATNLNSRGVYTAYNTGNGKTSQITWDFNQEKPTKYYTAGIQDLKLIYQTYTGNLLSRNDALRFITETFTYDGDDRLTGSSVNGAPQFSINYDGGGQGKMLQKTGVGNYNYHSSKIHLLQSLAAIGGGPDPNLTMGPQTYSIAFTAFRRPQTITHNNGYNVSYTYGAGQQRLSSVLKNGVTTVAAKSYWGNMEGLTRSGMNYEIYYISAGNGLNNIIVKHGGNINIYYTYTDQLGSIIAVTDEAGTIVAEQNFDAWGRKRNPANWTYGSVPALPDWLYRGFTGHEHIDETGMINMNARMYDYTTGQMLAPDNYVQYALSPSGYNRYLYANGNPLKYTDPSGDLSHAEWNQAMSLIENTVGTGGGNGGYISSGMGSPYIFKSMDEAFGYGVGYISDHGWWGGTAPGSAGQALANYSARTRGSGRVTAGMWNGYMSAQWSGYAYDINTMNASSVKLGNGFQTTGLTYAHANLGGFVTTFYSYSKAEALFLGWQNGGNSWDAANTTLGAFGLANGAKLTMLEGGAALNRGMGISKVNSISMIRTYGAAGAKYMKYAKGLGVAGSVVTTAYSGYKAFGQYDEGGMSEVFKHRDIWDAGVGAIGVGAAFMLSNPVGWGIGIGVLIYGGATLIYDAVNER